MNALQLSLTDAAAAIRRKEVSPVELTRAALDRIESVEGNIHAFALVTADFALKTAETAESEIMAGKDRGPLHGIPIGVKDLCDVAGLPTGCSSAVRHDHKAKMDAECVERLLDAGAVIVGKTHTHEFAYGVVTPTTRNPWDTERVPGGSSGGSAAAVASREVFVGIGTDTGGSIRIPASCCGTVGLKPTYGRVSKAGVTTLSWSLDHVGPLARTVRDAALVLQAIAGHDGRDPSSAREPVPNFTADLDRGVAGLVLGVPTNYFFDGIDPEVEAGVRKAIADLQSAGATVREVTLPMAEYLQAIEFAICLPEASAYHREMLRQRGDLYQPDVRLFLELGELVLATDYLRALRARRLVKEAWAEMFGDHRLDALIAPTLPAPAAMAGQEAFAYPDGREESVITAYVRTSCPANITGLPALSVPCGFTGGGLPFGLQVIGRPFQEATVLRIGQAYEAIAGLAGRAPGL